MFRFEELCLQDNECKEMVAEAWDGGSNPSLPLRLNRVGSMLQEWGRGKLGDLPRKISDTKAQLQRLQRHVQSSQVVQEAREAEKTLDELLKQQEIWWSQRSRANWLTHGDRNTRFFQQKATQRRKRNMIEKIKDDKGREFVDDPNIARVLVAYFSELFTSSSPSGVQEATSLVANRVSQAHLEVLADPFTKEEVEDALFQMHPTKAPCPDGFSALLSEALEYYWG